MRVGTWFKIGVRTGSRLGLALGLGAVFCLMYFVYGGPLKDRKRGVEGRLRPLWMNVRDDALKMTPV